MNIKKHIPNLITILNLTCGVFAILFFIKSYLTETPPWSGCFGPWELNFIDNGIFLILLATILDFLDGFFARMLNVKSEIGAQLDSLADMVTFGVAPGFLILAFLDYFFPLHGNLNLAFILIPIFSAIRLAKFNTDEEQVDHFKGLATPANAIFWIGIYLFLETFWYKSFFVGFLILLLIPTFSLLMVSNLRMFSLKLKNLKLEGDNIYRIILILGVVILTIIFGMFTNILAAIPFIILLYILLSVHYHYTKRKTT